jgi:hypothetical protein
LVETTVPVRIRPRIETMPVKGHFLSVDRKFVRSSSPTFQSFDVLDPEGRIQRNAVGIKTLTNV